MTRITLRPHAALALLLALGTAACDDSGLNREESNDILTEPEYNEVSDGVYEAQLRYNPKRIGQSEAKNLRVRHGGVTPLKVKDLYIEHGVDDGAGNVAWTRMDGCSRVGLGLAPGAQLPGASDSECWFIIDQGPELPLTLENDAFEDFSIVFRPTENREPDPWRAIIETNVREKRTIVVSLQVVATAPRIDAQPRTVPFSSPSQMASAPLQVFNRGTGQLVVDRFEVKLQSQPYTDPATQQPVDEFIVRPNAELPWTIAANRAESLTINYEPRDEQADHAILRLFSNDPQTPVLEIVMTSEPVTSTLVVQPNPVQFPEVRGAGQVEQALSFTNAGLKSLDVLDLQIDQPGEDYSLGDQQRSFQLAGGASREVTVTYRPRSPEGSNGTLEVTTNGADNVPTNELSVPLVSSGTQVAALQIDRLAVDFSAAPLAGMQSEQILLTNSGTAALEISRIGMSTDADAARGILPSDPEFTITAGGGAATLAAGEQRPVTVTFTRAAEDRNRHIGAVVIESNASTSPDSVNLVANPPAP